MIAVRLQIAPSVGDRSGNNTTVASRIKTRPGTAHQPWCARFLRPEIGTGGIGGPW